LTNNLKYLVSSGLVVVFGQELGNLLYVYGVIEGCRVTHLSLVGTQFALKALDQVTNGHTGGDSVRVDDDVRGQTFACEDHVFLSVKNDVQN